MEAEQVNFIKEVVDLFDEAEDRVKEVEQLAQDLSVPSINELRYVGYHLARALCEDDPEGIANQINKAKSHCKRAIYDAHEIGIIYMLEEIKLFKEELSSFSSEVLKVMPNYIEDLGTTNNASKFIAEIKAKHRGDRDSYYKECQPHYQALRDVLDRFNVAEPLILIKIEEQQKASQIQTRRFITTVSLTVLAITISIIVGGTLIYLKVNGSL